jgi:hypothetical protein
MSTAIKKESQGVTTKLPTGEKIAGFLIIAIVLYLFIAN